MDDDQLNELCDKIGLPREASLYAKYCAVRGHIQILEEQINKLRKHQKAPKISKDELRATKVKSMRELFQEKGISAEISNREMINVMKQVEDILVENNELKANQKLFTSMTSTARLESSVSTGLQKIEKFSKK
jgi:hypothetical protein